MKNGQMHMWAMVVTFNYGKPMQDEFDGILSEYAEALRDEISGNPMLFGAVEKLDIVLENGFVAFVDEALSADAFIGLAGDRLDSLREIVSATTRERLDKEERFNLYYGVIDFIEDDEMATKEQAKIAARLSVCLNQIWGGDEKTIAEVDRLGNELLSSLTDEQDNARVEKEVFNTARLRIGCTVSFREDKPFYAFVSLNFDDPYFRSNAQITKDGVPNREMDVLLASYEGQVPETEAEFREAMNSLLENAFPNSSYKMHMREDSDMRPSL